MFFSLRTSKAIPLLSIWRNHFLFFWCPILLFSIVHSPISPACMQFLLFSHLKTLSLLSSVLPTVLSIHIQTYLEIWNLEAHQFGSSHVTLFLKLFSKFYSPFSLNIAYRCQVLVVDQKPCISLTSANILLYLILGNQSSIIISTFKIWKLKLRGVKKLTQGQIAVTVRVLTWMQVCLIPRPELIVTKC